MQNVNVSNHVSLENMSEIRDVEVNRSEIEIEIVHDLQNPENLNHCLLSREHMKLHPVKNDVIMFKLFICINRKIIFIQLTSWDRNLESSNFLTAYFISSSRRNSTTPVPSLKTSAKQTSPASLIWSFKSCQLPDGGKPNKQYLIY